MTVSNYSQFVLFFIFCASIFVAGVAAYYFLDRDGRERAVFNRALILGETLLLGSIVIVGALFSLSFVGLYRAPFLWLVIAAGFLPLFFAGVRQDIVRICRCSFFRSPSALVFIALFLVMFFRNCYFMVDVDATTNYLYTAKVWLERGTSLIREPGLNYHVYFPQFDVVPYALGLSLFMDEPLFPELVVVFWRLIPLLLMYGYASHRLGKWYGLAGVMFILFNEHFFYSGANRYVILNPMIIAFYFAAAYNLWESRHGRGAFRLMLGLIFAAHVITNKYQALYGCALLMFAAVFVQEELGRKIKAIFSNKRWVTFSALSLFFVALWFIKNIITTGDPVFPILAGRFHVPGWTLQADESFLHGLGGLNVMKILKYLNYLFISQGIVPSKLVALMLTFLPLVILIALKKRNPPDRDEMLELCFWLVLSVLMLIGVTKGSHWDSRYYRFPIGIFTWAAMFGIYFVFRYNLGITRKWVAGGCLFVFALTGVRIVKAEDGPFFYPNIKENIGVIMNRIHMADIMPKQYPNVKNLQQAIADNPDKMESVAYYVRAMSNFPLYFVPTRPIVGVYRTNVIGWDSYDSEELVVKDLVDNGIKWVVAFDGTNAEFLSPQEFAEIAVQENRFPKEYYHADFFPDELRKNH